MITIKLLREAPGSYSETVNPLPTAAIDLNKISAMMVKVGGYDGLPEKFYSILVDGVWFNLKDQSEYKLVAGRVNEYRWIAKATNPDND